MSNIVNLRPVAPSPLIEAQRRLDLQRAREAGEMAAHHEAVAKALRDLEQMYLRDAAVAP